MENVDSPAKQAALDNKSAYAGNVSPDPELDVDQLGEQAGLNIKPEHPLSVEEDFEKRDQNRYELDVDSKQKTAKPSESVPSESVMDEIEIVKTETGQIEGIHTQPVESGTYDS
ncbi:MAG: DUF6335 family protein [Phormidesmis sp.]